MRFLAHRLHVLSLFVLCATALTACGDPDTESTAGDTATPVIQPIATQTITTSESGSLSFNGVVRSTERAELTFRVGGTLQEMRVDEGDKVAKGDTLAMLQQNDFLTVLNSAKVKYQKAQADYERAKQIYNSTQAISKSDLEKLEAEQALAKNALREAEQNLEYSTLTAPFDGEIARKQVTNHTNIQPNQTVYVLHNPDNLELVIHVPSRLFLKNSEARDAVATIEGIDNARLPVSFKYYSSDPEPLSQTYQVVMGFKTLKGHNVLPGMNAKVFPLASAEGGESAIHIPIDSVVPSNTGHQFVDDHGSDTTGELHQLREARPV